MEGDPQNFDNILTKLRTGKWNMIHFFGLSLGSLLAPSLVFAGSYLTPSVHHSCQPPSNEREIVRIGKCDYVIENTIDGKGVTTNQTVECSEWYFETDVFHHTLTSEFHLVCSREYVRPAFQTVFMFGCFIASPINGMLSDILGRKKLFVGGLLWAIVTVVLSSCLNNITALLILRFLTGLSQPPLVQTSYILAMEVCEPKYRSLVGIAISLSWAVGTIWWGVLGYLVRDWRWLQRISIIPAIVFIIFFMGITDESVRWLIVRGEHKRAVKTLKKAAKLNRRPLANDADLLENILMIQKSCVREKEEQQVNFEGNPHKVIKWIKNIFSQTMILYKTAELRKRIMLMYTVHFVSSTVYYGLSLNSVNFKLDPFIYMVVSGLMEVPAYTILAPIVAKFGRVWPTVFSFTACGISILALGLMPRDIKWLVITFAMIGKFSITSAYQIIYLISSELFPTEIKLQSLGTSYFISRIGSMLTPYITDFVGPKYPAIPSIVFGILSFIAGFAALFLPETLNKPIFETIGQLEMDSKAKRRSNDLDRRNPENDELKKFKSEKNSSRDKQTEEALDN